MMQPNHIQTALFRHHYVITSTTGQVVLVIINPTMVRVQDFSGAVFHPSDYASLLYSNIEHLESTPMVRTFNTSQMIAEGKLIPEAEACSYIYRQEHQGHVSLGILAEISLEDYHQNKIKKHEKTLIRPGYDHQSYKKQHVGPVVVSHRQNQDLDRVVLLITQQSAPFSQWTTSDGRKHSLWRTNSAEGALGQRFASIDSLYILDGHHRMEAAHQNYILSASPRPCDEWIQALIYSSQHVMVHPFHRVIKHLPENLTMVNDLLQLQDIEFTELQLSDLQEFKLIEELQVYEIILKMEEKLFGINFKNTSRNILEQVTSFRLQNEIFRTVIDQEVEKGMQYLPGIIDQAELFSHQIVFFVKQPAIDTVFGIADQDISMPPKSTWIEPKPCSHMVIRLTN